MKGEVYVTVEHSKKNDPVIIAAVFAIGAIIFLILAIVIPSVMINSAEAKLCAETVWLHPDEQVVCRPGTKKNYVGSVDSRATSLVKFYRMIEDRLSTSHNRRRNWVGSADLSKGAFIFPISSAGKVRVAMDADCVKGQCNTVKMYFLNYEDFDRANSSGSFNEDKYSAKSKVFTEHVYYVDTINNAKLYYLIIANSLKEAVVNYNISLVYTVYNVDNTTVVPCTASECTFESVGLNEAIVMEYIDAAGTGPELISASIKSERGSYGGAIFFAILFALLTAGCILICVLFILQMLGKISLYKRVPKNKGKSSEDNGSYKSPKMDSSDTSATLTVGNDDL